jgi:hypothetical protein
VLLAEVEDRLGSLLISQIKGEIGGHVTDSERQQWLCFKTVVHPIGIGVDDVVCQVRFRDPIHLSTNQLPAPPGGERGYPAPLAPARSRLLQRCGSPLPADGAGAVPDAGGLPRPLSEAPQGGQRQLRVPDLDKSGWATPTLSDAKKQTATVSICVKCRNYRVQWKRHGRQALIYAYWGYKPVSPDSVFTRYRLRFGIETSYRQMHEGRIRTTTRRPAVRLLSVGIALVLRNLWVWLHDKWLSLPRRGGRVILLERLRWETLLLWLLHVVEEEFGVADITYTERNVEYELACQATVTPILELLRLQIRSRSGHYGPRK